jgi:putative membrane protein
MMWDWYGWGGAGAWLMLVFMALFAAGVVIGFVYLVRALTTGTAGDRRQEAPPARRDDAREVLRRRYAAGEIEREEFLRRRQDLDDDA